jgi:hypothetical protein
MFWGGAGSGNGDDSGNGSGSGDAAARSHGGVSPMRAGGPSEVRLRAREEVGGEPGDEGKGGVSGSGTRAPLIEREFASTLQSMREALSDAHSERKLAERRMLELDKRLRQATKRALASEERLKAYRADRSTLRGLDLDVLGALEEELQRAIKMIRAEKNDRVRTALKSDM